MLWLPRSYNKGGSLKVAVCNDHHETYNIEGIGKVAVCNDHHEVITKEELEKLRYLMIIMKL